MTRAAMLLHRAQCRYGSGAATSKREDKATAAKKLTLVHGGPVLLSSIPNVKPKVSTRAYDKLTAMGVTVHVGKRAKLQARGGAAAGTTEGKAAEESKTAALPPSVMTGDGAPVQVELSDGSKVEGDVVLLCGGTRVNSQAYATSLADAVDDNGRLKVDAQHRVVGHEGRVWAIGDCCNTDEGKLAYAAIEQAKYLAAVLAKLASNPSAKVKDRKPIPHGVVFAPIGPHDGVGQLPNGMVVGKKMVPAIKGKDLFTTRFKAEFFGKALAKTLP